MSTEKNTAAPDASPELGELYKRMAAAQCDDGGNYDDVYADARAKLDALKKSAAQAKKEYQKLSAQADELETRLGDLKRGKKYKILHTSNSVIDFKEEQSGCFARGINIYKLMLLFFIGSFGGVIIEMLWCLVRSGYIESRAGLVIGPFNLLYGAGAVALTLALYKFRNRNVFIIFFGSMLVGSAIEYSCSWLLEVIFGTRSWDYSMMALNINGRICLMYSIFWGFLGVLWIKSLYPLISKLILPIPNKAGKIIAWALTIFLAFDAVITAAAIVRWSHRDAGNAPATSIGVFIDEHFPDERMEHIFANMDINVNK